MQRTWRRNLETDWTPPDNSHVTEVQSSFRLYQISVTQWPLSIRYFDCIRCQWLSDPFPFDILTVWDVSDSVTPFHSIFWLYEMSVTQWPLSIRYFDCMRCQWLSDPFPFDIFVFASPTVLIMMCLDVSVQTSLNKFWFPMVRGTASVCTSVRCFSSVVASVGNSSIGAANFTTAFRLLNRQREKEKKKE